MSEEQPFQERRVAPLSQEQLAAITKDVLSAVLSKENIEAISKAAAKEVLESVYIEIGKNVVKKAFLIVGALVVAASLVAAKGDKILPLLKELIS